jgi:hypothetical protein
VNARDELGRTIGNALVDHMGAMGYASFSTSDLDAVLEGELNLQTVADDVMGAGYRKPKVLGYVLVSRGGSMIGDQFSDRAAAQARADEWTNDCKAGGVDWDYRVAEIVEAAE